MAIYQEACLSKVPVDCEVYGLFGDLLPAELMEEGGELQAVGSSPSREGPGLQVYPSNSNWPQAKPRGTQGNKRGQDLVPTRGDGKGHQQEGSKAHS